MALDGRQGTELVEKLMLAKVIPGHFEDHAGFASPLSDFTDEMKRRVLADRILEVGRGDCVTI